MRVAAIDVGSNSIHMVIAQVEPGGRFRVLDRAKKTVRLGRGSMARLTRPAVDAGVEVLAGFRTLARRQGADRITAVATSAVREASNGGEFVSRVHRELGLRVRVIPGREEARLIWLGVSHSLDLGPAPVLLLDIGGGSVELVLVEAGRAVALESLKLGATRLTGAFLSGDPPREADMKRLVRHVEREAEPFLARCAGRGIARVVGTSGTLLNLVSMVLQRDGAPPPRDLHNVSVPAGEIRRLRRRLRRAGRRERLEWPGLEPKRADIVVAGSVVADHVLRRVGASELTACTWALREGILLDFVARHRPGIEERARVPDVRRRSVLRLARHLGVHRAHAEHVARLTLRLFDQLAEDLGLGPREREWLEYAALLHDIGHAIEHERHHHHAHYLITQGELLGFTAEEREVMGLVARYHRKSPPSTGDGAYAALPRPARRSVRALSALLRVADGLDRTHYGVVRDVEVASRGGRLVLRLATAGEDAGMEVYEAGRRSDLLRDVTGREVVVRVGTKKRDAVSGVP